MSLQANGQKINFPLVQTGGCNEQWIYKDVELTEETNIIQWDLDKTYKFKKVHWYGYIPQNSTVTSTGTYMMFKRYVTNSYKLLSYNMIYYRNVNTSYGYYGGIFEPIPSENRTHFANFTNYIPIQNILIGPFTSQNNLYQNQATVRPYSNSDDSVDNVGDVVVIINQNPNLAFPIGTKFSIALLVEEVNQ